MQRWMETGGPSEIPEEETRAFLSVYYSVLAGAASGDTSARDEVLAGLVPGLRGAGMPLGEVMQGVTRLSMILADELPAEHFDWALAFCTDYNGRVAEAYFAETGAETDAGG